MYGTLQFNLDPEGKCTQKEIDDIISVSGLDKMIKVEEGKKPSEFMIDEGVSPGISQMI